MSKEAIKLNLDRVNKHIDDAVEWNFGRCPNYPWFDALVAERDALEAKIKALTKSCTNERMCVPCYLGRSENCCGSTPAPSKQPTE